MSKIEEIVKGLKEMGFKSEGDDYVFDNVRQHQAVINGQPMIHEEHYRLILSYIGEGKIGNPGDESDGDIIHGFDIKDNDGELIRTVYVYDIGDLKKELGQ